MIKIQYWLIDFDDTLATSWGDWALNNGFPRLIQKHNLQNDTQQLHQAIMDAQAKSVLNVETDVVALLEGVFDQLGWSKELITSFLKDVEANYKPELFEDAIPLLERLKKLGKTVFILSNNPRSAERSESMGLRSYVEEILTPHNLQVSPAKPNPQTWDVLKVFCPDITPESTAIVGDDPWSDGAFAEALNLKCWIIDRHLVYKPLYASKSYNWVKSLNDIK